MKITEIILEDIPADPKKMPGDQVAALKGALSLPGISINKSNGNPYAAYRFGIALGVADGKKGGEMPAAGAIAGDPLLTTYTDLEFDMIKDAAEMTEAGSINQLSNNRSQEAGEINKSSPTRQVGAIQRKSK